MAGFLSKVFLKSPLSPVYSGLAEAAVVVVEAVVEASEVAACVVSS